MPLCQYFSGRVSQQKFSQGGKEGIPLLNQGLLLKLSYLHGNDNISSVLKETRTGESFSPPVMQFT